MTSLARFARAAAWPMAIFLPIWITFLRALTGGVMGWMMVVYVFSVGPIVLLSLLIITTLAWLRREGGTRRAMGRWDAIGLVTVWSLLFAHGFFIVDGGDVGEVGSIASNLIGEGFVDPSATISVITLALAGIVAVALVVLLIVELMRDKRAATAVGAS